VIDLLDHLHVTEAVVCGMSMGGYVALALFRLATRYIQGLILADTRAEPDSPEAIAARKAMQTTAKEKGAEAIAADMIPKLLGETTRATRPDVVERVRSLILERSAGSIAGALNVMMTRPDSTTLLSSIHVPTLVLVGEEDVVTPRGFAETLSRGIAGSELVSIAGAGHLSSLEQPEAFNAAVARFLSHRV
jgi:pimeloyl-ACP methyl ester carboxylesterase